jgi:hypothetical protein
MRPVIITMAVATSTESTALNTTRPSATLNINPVIPIAIRAYRPKRAKATYATVCVVLFDFISNSG